MFNKILIANRGEIAVRIIQACKGLGITTVALYTDADHSWLSRQFADEAVNIGTGPVAESYINFDKVINVAKRTGADAIHPGYGFLAENAAFARRCDQENIVFIGPSADVIDLMGNKAKAKDRVARLSIPVIPGFNQADASEAELINAANKMGYPVMLKAIAGGGGMGIRIVEQASEFAEALASVQQEAQSAFGDKRVLLEKYFPAVRHIEVQVLADQHGHAVHCCERECSVQRRRQKVIEEAPSSFVTEALRKKLCAASLKIVDAVGYYSVGTVEFVVSDTPQSEDFYFLEMNTRLQVEHGVTEAVTGLDLVQLQIAIAEGQSLPLQQSEIVLKGHAIEARLCAEQPSQSFQPITGTVAAWSMPEIDNLRIDTGITVGTEISAFYDSLIAKVIGFGTTRAQALRTLHYGLQRTTVLGLETNQAFIAAILCDRRYVQGLANTTYIENHQSALLWPRNQQVLNEAYLVAALALVREETSALAAGQGGAFVRDYSLTLAEQTQCITVQCIDAAHYQLTLNDREYAVCFSDDFSHQHSPLILAINGIEKGYRVDVNQDAVSISIPAAGNFVLSRPQSSSQAAHNDDKPSYTAAMAGQVVAVFKQSGATITRGEKLLLIESMKMEHSITAEADGIIHEMLVSEGSAIKAGMPLLTLHEQGETA